MQDWLQGWGDTVRGANAPLLLAAGGLFCPRRVVVQLGILAGSCGVHRAAIDGVRRGAASSS